MVEASTLLTYAAIVVGFVFITGPATLLTVARATSSGTRAGLATALGIAVGDTLHTTMAILGLSALLLSSALVFSLVKILGAAYLLYLGITALFATEKPLSTAPAALTPRQAFRQAILAELLNPKTAMFFVAFLPQFVDPALGGVLGQLAIFGAVLILFGFISTVTFALLAGRLSDAIRDNTTVRRWLNRVTGSIYCGLGLRLALQSRP